mgnify:CR=1 FL=1|jgi:hypothetical protein
MALQLDKKFESLIDGIVVVEGEVAEAIHKQTTLRPWMNFASAAFPAAQRPAKKQEIELKKTFDRVAVNEEYVKVRSNEEATAQEVALAKIAVDFLASCERDKRGQWRSRIRMVAHATGLRAGNANKSGPLRRNTVDYMERMFMKAQEKPSPT